jgi:hypothetical protein
VEFTFVGIPLIFILISIFEASRGMWIYTTMAHAVKEGARFAAVRGDGFRASCLSSPCPLTVAQVATAINQAGAGMIPTDVQNVTIGGVACGTLSACLTNGTQLNIMSGSTFTVTAQYNFLNALSLFWPGAGAGIQFNGGAGIALPAQAEETVLF